MQNTTNFNLQKPDYNNIADIGVLNTNFDKIDNGIAPFFVAALKSANVYEITTGNTVTSLSDGFGIRIAIPVNSTGAVSIVVDRLTAVPVKKPNGGAVSNFKANGVYALTYYNKVFILVSGGGCDGDKVTATEKDVLAPKTFIGSDEEIHTGSMPELGTVTKQLGINETFSLGEGHIKGLKVTQSIPFLNPSWGDIWETNQYTVGQHMYNNGANYALLKIPPSYYINGVNWISAYTPYLQPQYIVAGANILGVAGSATIESLGGFIGKQGTYIVNQTGTIDLGFEPSLMFFYNFTINNAIQILYFNKKTAMFTFSGWKMTSCGYLSINGTKFKLEYTNPGGSGTAGGWPISNYTYNYVAFKF